MEEEKTVAEREVKGAIGIDIGKREIVVFECKSLILALVDIRESIKSVVLEFLKTMEKV